jgi:plastocyanin
MSRKFAAIALFALLGAAVQTVAATLTVTVRQRDGRPLAGVVLTAEAQSVHPPPVPPVHAIVDQVNLAFVPDVIVIPVGSTVSFPNTDAVSHQVYSFSSARRFQLPLYRGKPYLPVLFDQPGLVTLGCNIHDNMIAYVVVTEAQHFGRTDASGTWTVPDLPGGTWRISLWHPQLNETASALERLMTVDAGNHAELTVQLAHALRPAPLQGRPHSWDAY